MKTIRMEEMNWVDIKESIEKGFTTVVIGIGSTEQHGPHLPTQTDTLVGDHLAHEITLKLRNALQAQTIRVGCSDHHLSFPGTISLKKETLKAIIYDYVESLARHGFKTIIFIPNHGGNFNPTKEAIEELQPKFSGTKIIGYTNLIGFLKAIEKIALDFDVPIEEAGAHGGEVETSQVLSLAENLVIKERFKPGYIGPLGQEEIKIIFEKGMPFLTKIGVIGDPTKANVEKGKSYNKELVDFLVKEIKKQL